MALKNTNAALRDILFDTIGALQDEKMDVERAKAIAMLAKAINDSAKNEVAFAKLQKQEVGIKSPFFEEKKQLGSGS